MNQSGNKFQEVVSEQCENIELQSENQIAQEYDKVPASLENIKNFHKNQNEVYQLQQRKLKFITFQEIKNIEEIYISSLKEKESIQYGDNSRSAGKYQWTPQISCFTCQQKTSGREDGIIDINERQKLINTPVLPLQNQYSLQIELKLRRGQKIQIKNVGVDRKLLKRLMFTILHTGYSLKLKALVPLQGDTLKIWKQMEMPLKLNENSNIAVKIFENIEGKMFISISEIQFTLHFKIPSTPIFYFLLCGDGIDRVTLQQTPNQEIKAKGKCETTCNIF